MTWGSPWDVSLIFSPGQRHEIEEKQQRALLREDEGVATDPPNRIDLDSGVVVIRLSEPQGDGEAHTAEADADADTATETDVEDTDTAAEAEITSEPEPEPDAEPEATARTDREVAAGPSAVTTTAYTDVSLAISHSNGVESDPAVEPSQPPAVLPNGSRPAIRPTARRTRRPGAPGSRQRPTPPAETA